MESSDFIMVGNIGYDLLITNFKVPEKGHFLGLMRKVGGVL